MGSRWLGFGVLFCAVCLYNLYPWYNPSPEELREHLEDKVVIVCGASSGIGEQVAYKYAEVGAKLIVSARSIDKLENVKRNCLSRGASSVHIIQQDFSLVDELDAFKKQVLEIHPRVDIIVLNHAAIPLGPWTGFPKQQDPNFVSRAFNINILSFIELTRLFLPDLERTAGLIQVTGSLAGWLPYLEAGLYSSTKHAVNGFFYSMQQELAMKNSSVSVSVYSLGLIMTNEMDTLLSSESASEKIPDFVKGSAEECGDIMVAGSINRPRNVDYPAGMVKFARFLSFMFPQLLDLLSMSNLGGVGYDEMVGIHSRLHDLGNKIKYQVGNH